MKDSDVRIVGGSQAFNSNGRASSPNLNQIKNVDQVKTDAEELKVLS